MTIDWTQPVIDARDMDADPLFDSQGRVLACRVGSVVYAQPAFEKLGLRNVAPPKPEPQRNTVKVGLKRNRRGDWIADTYPDTSKRSYAHIVECVWMSDGSPVPSEASGEASGVLQSTYADMADKYNNADRALARLLTRLGFDDVEFALAEIDGLEADRDAWRTKAEALQAEVERMKPFNRDVEVLCHQHGLEKVGLQVELGKLKDEAESMKPVADAAVAWVLPELRGSYTGDTQRLIDAVRTYQQSPKKTAAEAVANVAEMMGPVRNCTTCKWWDGVPSSTCLMPATCNWEAKSHD